MQQLPVIKCLVVKKIFEVIRRASATTVYKGWWLCGEVRLLTDTTKLLLAYVNNLERVFVLLKGVGNITVLLVHCRY